MIPHCSKITQLQGSVVHTQPHVNSGATNHPAIIVESKDPGRISHVAQMTSWTQLSDDSNGAKHHPTVTEKLPNYQIMRLQHLAINHHGSTVSHDTLLVLELANGKSLHF